MKENEVLLILKNLRVSIFTEGGVVKAVRGVELEIKNRETLGLVGETGCGKSILGLSILRLLPENAKIEGSIIFKNKNLVKLSEEEMRKIRGREIAWVPQSFSTSLNPVLKVGFQIAEVAMENFGWSKLRAWDLALELLRKFELLPAEKRANEYPHQFSGGMRQRALVAMGIAGEPSLIIADEPTKGVDASRKQTVLEVFQKINKATSLLLITHDLLFAERLCDRIAVMYCGKIVEVGATREFFEEPLHPYSKGLLNSLPTKGLKPITGDTPSMVNPPTGCTFHPRCEFALNRCRWESPPLRAWKARVVGCWLYD
jgi:peptide/nickel transport system ATP-binding protein